MEGAAAGIMAPRLRLPVCFIMDGGDETRGGGGVPLLGMRCLAKRASPAAQQTTKNEAKLIG